MKKRFWLLTTAVVLAVLMLTMPIMASAQTGGAGASTAAVWDGVAAGKFAGGTGTKDDPYQITSGGHLALLANTINRAGGSIDLGGLYFKVMNDIDMNGNPIMPIGGDGDGVYFSGYFDGNNKTISNLNLICETVYSDYIWTDSGMFQNVGLFGCVKNAVIRNVVLKDLHMTDGATAQTYFNVGALVGKAIDSQIINCHVDSDLIFECCRPSSQYTIYAGGMIGFLQDNGTVKGCTYDGTLRVNGRADFENDGANRVATVVGGLIGRIDGDVVTADTLVTVEDCAVSGTMLSIGKTYHLFWGGMVGVAYNGWGAADDSVGNPIILYMKNCISTVTMDVSGVDMSYTPNGNNYMNCGGIISQTGSFCMDLENVHFIGDLSSVVSANGMNIRETKVAGIVYQPRTNSTYSNVTTNFDKVTVSDMVFEDDGETVKFDENWKGNWDRDTCAVNTSEQKDIVLATIAANIADIDSYDDGYRSEDFGIDNPFTAPTTGMCGDNAPWNLDLDTKTLTIYGSGYINDYNFDSNLCPWSVWAGDIETVV